MRVGRVIFSQCHILLLRSNCNYNCRVIDINVLLGEMISRKIRNVENLNEYLSQCGDEYSMLGFDINTVIGAVMSKTYR